MPSHIYREDNQQRFLPDIENILKIGVMAHVAEHLPSMCEALSLIPSTKQNKQTYKT
jgi:hypothetical protein